jgi:Tfp pilus assembly protein PilV
VPPLSAILQEKLMLRSLCNKKGMSMLEVLIAIFLTTTGIMALFSLQPQGWKTMAKADYLGRASGILYKTLENYETIILNPCNAVTLGAQAVDYVKVSGQGSTISGDMTYTVNTTIVQDGANASAFVVTVTVTWPPANTTGIKESQTVARQELYRFPTGCPNA